MTIENGYVNVAGNGKTQTYSTNLQHNLTAQRHRKTEPHKNAWRELVRAKCAQEITVND
jgi:hypothetical protein